MTEKDTHQPHPVPTPNTSGYPDNVPNTQTKQMRGKGAATKGTGFSGKSD